MDTLAWLAGHCFQSLARREHDWIITLDTGTSVIVACLWRLTESGRIRCTSEDDGQQFGLPAPVDAAAEVNRHLTGAVITDVRLQQGLLDLELCFSTGHVLQIIPDSAGYESWNVSGRNREYIAVGGGDLIVFGGDACSG